MAQINDIQVLLFDTDQSTRRHVRHLLSADGVRQIIEAANAADAFKLLNPSVNLLLLGSQSDLDFARRVRRHIESRHPAVPILLVTAHTELSHITAARDAGINALVKAPVEARALLARIASVLADKRQFIREESYVGPDRRLRQAPAYAGPFRRESDGIDLDELCA